MTKTKVHGTWEKMRQRCCNPNNKAWQRYGGRGIEVCPQWRDSFEQFYADMGDPPSDDHSIDRIDNNGNYELGNCRWATWEEQNQNRRDNRLLAFNGKVQCVTSWAKEIGINPSSLHGRLCWGWSVERGLTTPVKKAWAEVIV